MASPAIRSVLDMLDTFQGISLPLSVGGGYPLKAVRAVYWPTGWIDSKGAVYHKWYSVKCTQLVWSVAQSLAEGQELVVCLRGQY